MVNREFFQWADTLSAIQSFQNCLPLTEKQSAEQYDMEILVRYFVYRYGDLNLIQGNEDVGDYLTSELLDIMDGDFNYKQEKELFEKTFDYLESLLSDDSFRKYDARKNKFTGAFSISSFESIVVGISENIDSIIAEETDTIKEKIKSIYSHETYITVTQSNIRPINRLKRLVLLSRDIFSNG